MPVQRVIGSSNTQIITMNRGATILVAHPQRTGKLEAYPTDSRRNDVGRMLDHKDSGATNI